MTRRYIVGTEPTAVTVHHDHDARALAQRIVDGMPDGDTCRVITVAPDAVDIIDAETGETLVPIRPR